MKNILLGCSVILTAGNLQAQDSDIPCNYIDSLEVSVLDAERNRERGLTQYVHLREADAMYSKRVWQVIDLKEKLNLPLAYPKSSFAIKTRKNLFDIIHDAALKGCIHAYNPYKGIREDDEFTELLTAKMVALRGGGESDTIQYPDPITDTLITRIIPNPLDRNAVIKWKLKEEWFFDKQKSMMDVRIIGIAPVIEFYTETGEYAGDQTLYWVYFPEIRDHLKNRSVYNRHNDAQQMSFDDLFQKRMFSSYIVKESNVYDRRIKDYSTGMDALLEASRIKNDLFMFEHDLWEF